MLSRIFALLSNSRSITLAVLILAQAAGPGLAGETGGMGVSELITPEEAGIDTRANNHTDASELITPDKLGQSELLAPQSYQMQTLPQMHGFPAQQSFQPQMTGQLPAPVLTGQISQNNMQAEFPAFQGSAQNMAGLPELSPLMSQDAGGEPTVSGLTPQDMIGQQMIIPMMMAAQSGMTMPGGLGASGQATVVRGTASQVMGYQIGRTVNRGLNRGLRRALRQALR